MSEQKRTYKKKKVVSTSSVVRKTKNKTRDDESGPVYSHPRHLRCPGPSRKYPGFLNRVCGYRMKALATDKDKKRWECPACGNRITTKADLV
jgi:hypothetical protein